MEDSIKTIVSTFLLYTKGNANMNSSTFKKFVKKNLGGIMEDADSSSAVKEMQQGLDENSDGKVNFEEYFTLLGSLAKSLSERKTGETQTQS